MANDAKTLKDAKDAISSIAGFAHMTQSQIQLIEKDLKEQKVPLQSISDSIETLRKDAKGYHASVTTAEKALKEVEKLKTADAVKAAKDLDTAIKAADKTLSKFDANIIICDKVWQKCWDAEKALRASIDKGIGLARGHIKTLSNYVVSLPEQAKALQAACANKLPEAKIKTLIDGLAGEAKSCGSEITTAQSVASWIQTVLKDRGVAYHPEVIRLAAEADNLQQQLSKYAALAKSAIGAGLTAIKDARAVVA